MDFNSTVETISSSQLDALFGVAPSATPGAEDLIVGSQDEPANPFIRTTNSDIPVLDLDNLEDAKIEKPEEKVEEKTEDDKNVEVPQDEPAKEEEPVTETPEEAEQQKTVLKNTVNFLIEKGIWKDFDDRDNIEIDAEKYADLAAAQEQAKIDDMFSELIDSTGPYGKAIISHIKNGGNPDEVIDIFKEQKQIESLDISQPEVQTALIEKYYSEVVGWSKAKINKYVDNLRGEEDGVEGEAKEIQQKFDKIHKDQIVEIEKAEEKRQQEKDKVQKEYINTLTSTIDSFENFTDKEKKLVKDSVLKFNKKLEDGTPVNEFYMKFYEIQRNPKDYVDLIHFVMDKKGYQEKYNKKADNKATDKAWNFVKGNAAVNKKTGGIPTPDNNKSSNINFSSLFKK